MHQLAESGGGVKGAESQQATGRWHRVGVLLLHLLSAAATCKLQQGGGAVEPSAQPGCCCCCWGRERSLSAAPE